MAYAAFRWVDLVLCGLSVAVGAYIFIDLTGIFDRQGDWSRWDIATGIALILLVLEAHPAGDRIEPHLYCPGFPLFRLLGSLRA